MACASRPGTRHIDRATATLGYRDRDDRVDKNISLFERLRDSGFYLAWEKSRHRNFLRHEYDRIDGDRIWITVERDLAPLKTAVEAALRTLRNDEKERR